MAISLNDQELLITVRTWQGSYYSRDIPGGVETSPVRSEIYRLTPGGQPIPVVEMQADFASYSPCGNWVYFQSNTNGYHEIYRCQQDGAELQLLTEDLGEIWRDCFGYHLSADGRRMVYTAHNGEIGRVVVADADGTDARFLAPELGYTYMAALDADGERVVFSGPATGYRLMLAPFRGGEPTLLTPEHPDSYGPRFLPNSDAVIFIRRDGDIYRIEPDVKPVRLTKGNCHLHFQLSEDDLHGSTDAPDISPDGQRIAFVARAGDEYRICTMRTDGSEPTTVASRAERCGRVKWSGDGRQISFVSPAGAGFQLFIASASGGTPQQITDINGAVYWNQWRPLCH